MHAHRQLQQHEPARGSVRTGAIDSAAATQPGGSTPAAWPPSRASQLTMRPFVDRYVLTIGCFASPVRVIDMVVCKVSVVVRALCFVVMFSI